MPITQGIPMTATMCRGPAQWQEGRTGDPQRDLMLLQRISCIDPEAFWAPVLRQMRVKFVTPPTR